MPDNTVFVTFWYFGQLGAAWGRPNIEIHASRPMQDNTVLVIFGILANLGWTGGAKSRCDG